MSDFPIPDPFEKKVSIPVKINKSKIEFFYGGDLPQIKDGTFAELIVPRYAIVDSEFIKRVSYEKEIDLKVM